MTAAIYLDGRQMRSPSSPEPTRWQTGCPPVDASIGVAGHLVVEHLQALSS